MTFIKGSKKRLLFGDEGGQNARERTDELGKRIK